MLAIIHAEMKKEKKTNKQRGESYGKSEPGGDMLAVRTPYSTYCSVDLR